MTNKKEQPDPTFDHPPHFFYPRTPRRELDFEASDLRRIIDYGESQTRLGVFLETCRDFFDNLKRRLRAKLRRRQ